MQLHDLLLRQLFEKRPAEFAHPQIGVGQDRAAVAGMAFDDLALPFRIEQIGIALGRVFRLHQIGVVADDFEPGAKRRMHAVRIDLIARKMLGHILGDVGLDPIFCSRPIDEMRRVGAAHHVDGINPARLFLCDALKHAFGA